MTLNPAGEPRSHYTRVLSGKIRYGRVAVPFSHEDEMSACKRMLQTLLNEAMPEVLSKLVGPAAFIDAFEIVSDAVAHATERLRSAIREKLGEGRLSLREEMELIQEKIAEFMHDAEGVDARVELGDNEIIVELEGVDATRARLDPLHAAIYLGMLAGLLKALGEKEVKPARDRHHAEMAARHMERGWVVWMEERDGRPAIIARRVG